MCTECVFVPGLGAPVLKETIGCPLTNHTTDPHNPFPPTQKKSSEAEATAFLTPPGRPPLPPGSLAALPPCLSPFESARVQAEAAGRVERAREELRRYRVRHEMLLRGKEAEIKQVGWEFFGYSDIGWTGSLISFYTNEWGGA